MKRDLEILIALLLLVKVLTSIRLTSRHTLLPDQLRTLQHDVSAACSLAHYKALHHNELDGVLGKKFLVLYGVLHNMLPRLQEARQHKGVYEVMSNPDAFWYEASVQLLTGFDKNDGLSILEDKRKLCYLALSTVIATGAKPSIVPKNAVKILQLLLSRIFNSADPEHYLASETLSSLDLLRRDAICSIYRLIDLAKQYGTLSIEGRKNNVLHAEHIQHVKNYTDPKAATIGHSFDVLCARHLTNTKVHTGFVKVYTSCR